MSSVNVNAMLPVATSVVTNAVLPVATSVATNAMLPVITLDIESYYDSYTSVSRGKMTYVEYARAADFELFGASIQYDDGLAIWYRPAELIQEIATFPKDYILVGHNLPFDGCVLDELGITLRPTQYFCTLAAARGIYNSSIESAGLNALAKEFLEDEKTPLVLENTKGKHWVELTSLEQQAMGMYCCHDTYLTYLLYKLLSPQLPLNEQITLDLTLRMYLEPKLVVDQELLHTTIKEADKNREALIKRAGVILKQNGEQTLKTLSSNVKFPKALSKYTPIPKKPSPSVEGSFIPALAKNDLEMQALCQSTDHNIATLCEARLNAKSNILKTRAERLLRDDVPLSRTYLNYAGALASTRDSGGQKSNKQNFPRGSNLRAAIKAPKGFKLMVIDSSNIELRTMFLIAGQTDKIERIRNDEDLYTHSAATTIYHTDINNISHDQRAVGKVQMLSLQYGASWSKMQYIFAAGLMGPPVVLDDFEAERIWTAYRMDNLQVKRFWDLCNTFILNMNQGIEHTYNIPGTDIPLYTTKYQSIYSHSCGLTLHFKDLEHGTEGWKYKSRAAQNKIYGAMLCGRLNQHFARNIVFQQINQIAKHYPLVLRVHDEGGFLVPDDPEEIQRAEALALQAFATAPDFAAPLPCSGEVVTANQYEKPG